MKVKDCMCNEVCCATPNSTVQECATMMCNKHIGCVPVCDNTQNVVGLITDRDIILRCVACNKDPQNTPISEIMTCNPCCCTPEVDVSEAEKLMSENQVKRIPVVENNKIVGILSLGDLAQNQDISNQKVATTFENICNCGKKNAE